MFYKDGKTEMVPMRALMVARAGGENREEAGEPKGEVRNTNKKKRSERKNPLF